MLSTATFLLNKVDKFNKKKNHKKTHNDSAETPGTKSRDTSEHSLHSPHGRQDERPTARADSDSTTSGENKSRETVTRVGRAERTAAEEGRTSRTENVREKISRNSPIKNQTNNNTKLSKKSKKRSRSTRPHSVSAGRNLNSYPRSDVTSGSSGEEDSKKFNVKYKSNMIHVESNKSNPNSLFRHKMGRDVIQPQTFSTSTGFIAGSVNNNCYPHNKTSKWPTTSPYSNGSVDSIDQFNRGGTASDSGSSRQVNKNEYKFKSDQQLDEALQNTLSSPWEDVREAPFDGRVRKYKSNPNLFSASIPVHSASPPMPLIRRASPPIPHIRPVDPPIPHNRPVDPPMPHNRPVDPPMTYIRPVDPPMPHNHPVDPPMTHIRPAGPSMPHNRPVGPQMQQIRPVDPPTTHSRPVDPPTTHNRPVDPPMTHIRPASPSMPHNRAAGPQMQQIHPVDPPMPHNRPVDPPMTHIRPVDPPTTHNRPVDPPTTHNCPVDPPTTHIRLISPPMPLLRIPLTISPALHVPSDEIQVPSQMKGVQLTQQWRHEQQQQWQQQQQQQQLQQHEQQQQWQRQQQQQQWQQQQQQQWQKDQDATQLQRPYQKRAMQARPVHGLQLQKELNRDHQDRLIQQNDEHRQQPHRQENLHHQQHQDRLHHQQHQDRLHHQQEKQQEQRPVRGRWPRSPQGGVDDYLPAESWYHPHVGRADAEAALRGRAQEGVFLVRQSQTLGNDFVLSVLVGLEVKHLVIGRDVSGLYYLGTLKEDSFPQLAQLLQHLQVHGVEGKYRITEPVGELQPPAADDSPDPWRIDASCLLLKPGPVNELGRGRYGVVYRALLWDMVVAVKMIHGTDTSYASLNIMRNFGREVEALRRLRHPRLTRLLGVTAVEGRTAIIMEYMSNGSLLDYLQEVRSTVNTLKREKLAAFGVQTAEGMAYLEQQRVIHRDLAARNLLLGQDMTVKIADFGLARLLKEDVEVVRDEDERPLRWMALESLLSHEFSSKSDVWSYGIVLLENYTLGDAPYSDLDDSFVIPFLQAGNRATKPQICPDDVYELMTVAWHPDPAQRPSFHRIVDWWEIHTKLWKTRA